MSSGFSWKENNSAARYPLSSTSPKKTSRMHGGGNSAYGGDGQTLKGNSSSSSDMKKGAIYGSKQKCGESFFVVAVGENRSREVGVAAVNLANPHEIILSHISDNQSFCETLGLIQSYEPVEILVPDTHLTRDRPLINYLKEEFGNSAKIVAIARQYFDQTRGAQGLVKHAGNAIDPDLSKRYITMGAFACLLKYSEFVQGITFAEKGLNVSFCSPKDRLQIDFQTALNLELISNARTGNQQQSLFGVINNTKTTVGGRLLRATLLAPSSHEGTINRRQDFVSLLLRNEKCFWRLCEILPNFVDLDRLLTSIAIVPKVVTPRAARQGVTNIIGLKHTLRMLPDLVEALSEMLPEGDDPTGTSTSETGEPAEQTPPAAGAPQGSLPERNSLFNSDGAEDGMNGVHGVGDHGRADARGGGGGVDPLLEALLQTLSNPAFDEMLKQIDMYITESTAWSKSPLQLRQQECFAVRPGMDGLLDVARKTYLGAVEQIHALSDEYSLRYNLPGLKLAFRAGARGYHLKLPKMDEVPGIFVQAVSSRSGIVCSTEQLISLNNRRRESLEEIMLLTHKVIQELLKLVRESVSALFSMTEAVALLDMLLSFADLVSGSDIQYVRPEIQNSGALVIKQGKHPVVASLFSGQRFVGNDTYLAPMLNFEIVTGPNCAGKSTHLRQVALITIMAQAGCFVPAMSAYIPIRDRLFTRVGTSDDLESNTSTFLLEMKEMAYILENCTPSSLILIDELGRGTSMEDGLGIAWAISEELVSRESYTLFVTHFHELTELSSLYPNVKNCHLKAAMMENSIKYSYVVDEGLCAIQSDYGISMAHVCGLPTALLDCATRLRGLIGNKLMPASISSSSSSASHAFYGLLQHLLPLRGSSLSHHDMRLYLDDVRRKFSFELEEESSSADSSTTTAAISSGGGRDDAAASALIATPPVVDSSSSVVTSSTRVAAEEEEVVEVTTGVEEGGGRVEGRAAAAESVGSGSGAGTGAGAGAGTGAEVGAGGADATMPVETNSSEGKETSTLQEGRRSSPPPRPRSPVPPDESAAASSERSCTKDSLSLLGGPASVSHDATHSSSTPSVAAAAAAAAPFSLSSKDSGSFLGGRGSGSRAVPLRSRIFPSSAAKSSDASVADFSLLSTSGSSSSVVAEHDNDDTKQAPHQVLENRCGEDKGEVREDTSGKTTNGDNMMCMEDVTTEQVRGELTTVTKVSIDDGISSTCETIGAGSLDAVQEEEDAAGTASTVNEVVAKEGVEET